MNKFLFGLLLGCTVLQAQPGINIQAVRDIRLQNLKRDYTGSTIRFIVPGSTSVMGVLKDVTDKNFIISHSGSPAIYGHEKIDYVFLDGGHKYETVLDDLKSLTKVIENNGVILCDDYDLTYAPGVKKAIDECVLLNNFNLKILNSRFAEIIKNTT